MVCTVPGRMILEIPSGGKPSLPSGAPAAQSQAERPGCTKNRAYTILGTMKYSPSCSGALASTSWRERRLTA